MPLLLPPFGRGGTVSGGGSGLPPRLQPQQQDTEVSTGVNKRPAYLPHAPGGRGIRLNWNRQPPGYTNGMGPRDRRLDSPEAGFTGVSSTQEKEQGKKEKERSREMRQSGSLVLDPEEFPALPSRTLERMSSKGSSNSSTDGEMAMPSGCPLPAGTFTVPPPPPAPAPSGPRHNSLAPSPFLFPPPASVSQSQVPFSPYLVVPHVDNSAPINVNAKSSSDPTGTDLPMNDIATLRFFFNLGLEYYRLCMLFQLQQQQQYAAFLGSHQMAAAAAAAGPVQTLDGAIYVGDLEDIKGQSSSKEGPSNSDKTVRKDKQKAEKAAEKTAEPEASAVVSKGGSAEKSDTEGTVESAKSKEETVDKKDSDNKMKVSLPSHCEDTAVDSGCASDVSTDGCLVTDECLDTSRVPCLFDNHSDNSDSQSNIPADSHSDSSSQHSTSNLSVLSSSSGSDCSSISSLPYQKPYYTPLRTRNSPKLLKPLKDIPPRFQKMLSCNPAIRQDQFEGQPIMRQAFHGNGHHQHKPKSVVVSANNLSDLPTYHSFNPHAESFVPRSGSLVSTNPCSSTNSSSCTRSNSSSSMYSTCPSSSDMTGVPPSECCSTSSSESGSAGVGDGSVVSWSVPPPTGQNVPVSGPIAPTYTIHIHSAGCTIEPAAGVCSLSGNHCVSAASPAGSYAVSNALPAAPANTYMTQDPSAAAHSVVPAAPVPTAPAPPPPGGIVYYCQQPQQPQQPESYTYSATTYTVPAPQATPQYVYTNPPGYQTYENYAYS